MRVSERPFRWGYGAAVARQSNTLKVGRSTLPNLKTFFLDKYYASKQ